MFLNKYLILLLAAAIFSSCGTRSESSVKFTQYYLKGEQLYALHCSNCHQKDGSGLRKIYPPLDSSDFMNSRMSDVICLIRKGKTGEIIVNNTKFNQPMPPFPNLTDIEIAEISTYIYNTWSHKKGLIDVKEASRILSECK